MRAELTVSAGLLYGFLAVLARVGGVFVFVPVPGFRGSPEFARLALVMAVTVALFPVWPVLPGDWTMGRLVAMVAGEAMLGLAAGTAVAFLTDSLLLASQVFGLQAGYSYAQAVDPTSQADSSVLQVMAQLGASLLFFAFGLEREILKIFTRSFEALPPGGFVIAAASAEPIWKLGSVMFSTAMRLAMPVVALLILIDLTLALLSRINAQLQLLTLAFPVKMLATLALLAATSPLLAVLYGSAAEKTVQAIHLVLER